MKKGGCTGQIKKKLLAIFKQTWLMFSCFTLDKFLSLHILEFF